MEISKNPSTILNKYNLSLFWIFDKLSKKRKISLDNIKKIDFEDISGNKGYASFIYKFAFHLKNEENPIKFIMKIPTDCQMEKVYKNLLGNEIENSFDKEKNAEEFAQAHNTECDFYEIFGGGKFLPMPEIYHTQKIIPGIFNHGIILLDDLSEEIAIMEVSDSLNEKQIKNIAGHLAKFQAFLLKSNDQKWRDAFGKYLFPEMELHMSKQALDELKAYKPGIFDKNLKLLEKISRNYDFNDFSYHQCCELLGLPSVICHGDLWAYNILFKKGEDGMVSNEVKAFIDFTDAFIGNPMTDLALLIVFSVDAEIRRKLEFTIVEYFYEQFRLAFGITGNPLEGKISALKEAYAYAMVCSSVDFAKWTVYFNKKPLEANETEQMREDKIEILLKRTQNALEDAVKYLKIYAPIWLNYDI